MKRERADIVSQVRASSVSIGLPHDNHSSPAGSNEAAVSRVSNYFAAVLGNDTRGTHAATPCRSSSGPTGGPTKLAEQPTLARKPASPSPHARTAR